MFPFIPILGFQIPSYGLCMTFGFAICCYGSSRRVRALGLSIDDFIILYVSVLGSAIIFGGLFYIFASYSVKELVLLVSNGNWSFLSNIGLVFYGGLFGGATAALLIRRLLKIGVCDLEQCMIPFVPLGHAIGRVGCLLAGCCHGVPYVGRLAVHNRFYPEYMTFFPIQLIEAILNLCLFGVLLGYSPKARRPFLLTSFYLFCYSIIRFVLEYFRGDTVRGIWGCFSTSQWISLFLIICSIVMGIWNLKRKAE